MYPLKGINIRVTAYSTTCLNTHSSGAMDVPVNGAVKSGLYANELKVRQDPNV